MRIVVYFAFLSCLLLASIPARAEFDSPLMAGQIRPPIEDFESYSIAARFQAGIVPRDDVGFAEAMRRLGQVVTDPEAAATVGMANGVVVVSIAKGLAAFAVLRGQQGAALILLLRAHELDPRDTVTLEMIAGLVISMGLPNEGRAILAEIERIGPDNEGGMIDAEAVRHYLGGYAEYLHGNIDIAEDMVRDAWDLDPGIQEAPDLLAMIEIVRGNQAAAHEIIIDDFWSGIPKGRVMAIYKSKETEIVTPASMGSVDYSDLSMFMIPAADLFDLSKGKAGKLPRFPDPETAYDQFTWSTAFSRTFYAEGNRSYDMTVPYQPLREAIGVGQMDRMDYFVAYYMDYRITRLWLDEPEVRDLWDKANAEWVALQPVIFALQAKFAAMTPPGTECGDRIYASQVVLAEMRAAAAGYRTAFENFYRTHGLYASALARNVGNDQHSQWLEVYAEAMSMTHWSLYYKQLEHAYAVGSTGCVSSGSPLEFEIPEWEEGDNDCPAWLQGKGVEVKLGETPLVEGAEAGLSFSLGLSCESWSVEVSGEVVEVPFFGSLSMFGQAEFARSAGVTVYSGFKLEQGLLGGVQTGLYAEVDADGSVRDIGAKGSITEKLAIDGPTGNLIPIDIQLASQEMKFTFLSDPVVASGPKVFVGDRIKVLPPQIVPPPLRP